MLTITSYIGHFSKIWEESPDDFPVFHRKYLDFEQLQREQNLEVFQQKLKKMQSKMNVRKIRKSDPGSTFFPVFRSFLETVFDFERQQLEIILSDQFKNVSKDFFYRARKFGPELKPESIYQGLRNVWIMNGLQLMMGLPVEITPSIFGYSMIYPYSDNLLDDPSVTDAEKKDFSERFNQRLHGEMVIPKNHTEMQLFRLVELFEQQYSRKEFPKVYESLYAIQKGQTDSLKLLQKNGLKESGIKDICFEKGGASVLADGYLVAGRLTSEQEQALFGYGVYLQLLDDIQDVKEDTEANTRTIFSCANSKKLDSFVNRTVHFGRTALEEMNCFDRPETPQFLKLMNRSIETMIIESVGINNTCFSTDWLAEIEKYSPLRFEFVRRKRSQSKSQRLDIFQKYFNQNQPEMVTAF